MDDDIAGFEWDAGNWPKCGKHGLTQALIESVFYGEVALFDDLDHGGEEVRIKAIGRSAEGRYVFVVFTIRARDNSRHIRPISARYMHRKEIEAYEQARTS